MYHILISPYPILSLSLYFAQEYPAALDFSGPPLPLTHLQPMPITVTSQAALLAASSNGAATLVGNGSVAIGGSGTLRRGILRGVTVGVPPPDVTHHTGATAGGTGSPLQLLHELHPVNLSATTLTTSTTLNGSMTTALPLATSTLPRQPHGILKDPNRNKQQQQHQQHQQQLQQQQQLLNASLVGVPVSAPMGSLQILNLPATSAGLGSNLLMTSSATYDPASLSSFNAPPSSGPVAVSVAYTDADGHLV